MQGTIREKWLAIPVLTIGIVAISFASILIKLCQAPSLVIAAYRLFIASLFYWAIVFLKKNSIRASLAPGQLKIAVVSGLFLAVHFASWITSLQYTSVASSVVLVQSAPIFVAIGGALFLGERPSLLMTAGILVSFVGAVTIGMHDFAFDPTSLPGNLLALVGAIGASGYYLAGRKLRATLSTLHYVTIVYSVAALILVAGALVRGLSFIGYSPETFLLLFAIAMVPQVIGHTSLNWALKYFTAAAVAVVALGEPIGASMLAWTLLGEQLDAGKIIGGTFILTGVIIVILAESGGIVRKS